ncbi:DUF308 domain-containing protein [Halorussus salinisoli]|uniref:DUF308 domain-containing protein n=1 Tax=Halorussus salinisoli TaxID=2558242 RepID=UPI0010C23AA7|nr:DUF308 domain-containing protein [Halorussus salinisoli]
MPNDPYTDDEYDDTYKKVHGDEPARDQYAGDEATDDTFFPSGVGGTLSPTGWGIWPSNSSVDADYDGTEGRSDATEGEYDRTAGTGPATTESDDEGGTWLDEGLIGALLLVGVVLFFFPEPTTSAIGIAMVAMGVVAWIADWAM